MIKIALQLYTLRNECEKDLRGTLEKIAEIGYKGVEFAGFYGMEAEELKNLLKEVGLKPVSAHVGIEELRSDIMKYILYAKTLGLKNLTISYLPEEMISSEKSTLETALILEELARKLKIKGISLSFHNHVREFTTYFGKRCVEQILFDESPALNFEVDTGWSGVAGVDNREFLKKLGYRLDFIHIKDVDKAGNTTEVGEGELEIMPAILTANQLAVRWGIVEQDEILTLPPFESVAKSLRNVEEKYLSYLF